MSLIFGMVEISTRFSPSVYMETLCYLQLCLLTVLLLPDGWHDGVEVTVLCLHNVRTMLFSPPTHTLFLGGNQDCILGSVCFHLVVTPKYKSLQQSWRLPALQYLLSFSLLG